VIAVGGLLHRARQAGYTGNSSVSVQNMETAVDVIVDL
jgi:hypothetical protein